MDWMRAWHLRAAWTAIIFGAFIYILRERTIYGGLVMLHSKFSGSLGYIIASLCGIIVMCCFWWFTGKIIAEPQNSEESRSKDQRGKPTAKEIADEMTKQLRADGLIPQSQLKQKPTFSEKPAEPTFTEKVETGTIVFGRGGITSIYQLSQLAGEGKEPFVFGDYKPIRLYLDQGKLFADVSVYAGFGQPPIEIKRNEFVLRKPGWDRNFDSTALEVVNESKSPVFQLIYDNPFKIVVNGIFPTPSGLMLAGDYGDIMNADVIRKGFTIQRLFKYPSNQYVGKREEILNVVPGPKLKERAISLSYELDMFADLQQKHLDDIMHTPNTNNIDQYQKALTTFMSLYDDKYVLQSARISDELAATGFSVGSLQSESRLLSNPRSVKQIATQFRILASQLP